MLLPTLKFHDLVFGQVLGEGAFSTVKYARHITKVSHVLYQSTKRCDVYYMIIISWLRIVTSILFEFVLLEGV